MNSSVYKIAQKCMAVFAFLVYVFSLAIASLNQVVLPELFLASINSEGSRKYVNEVTPAPAAFFIIWPIIFLWNLIGAFYILVSIFLSESKSPVNAEPTLLPISFFVAYVLGFSLSTSWLFAFDREILGLGLSLLILATASLYVALGISYKRLHDDLKQLDTKEKRVMLWLVRILIQNGLALPATWLTIATCLNLTDVIIYQDSFGLAVAVQRGNISIVNGSSAVLAVILFIAIVWFILDNFVFEKYTCYTFTVFPVFILGSSALVAKLRYRVDSNQNLILACVILGFSVFAFIFRTLIFSFRLKPLNQRKNVAEVEKPKTEDEKV